MIVVVVKTTKPSCGTCTQSHHVDKYSKPSYSSLKKTSLIHHVKIKNLNRNLSFELTINHYVEVLNLKLEHHVEPIVNHMLSPNHCQGLL